MARAKGGRRVHVQRRDQRESRADRATVEGGREPEDPRPGRRQRRARSRRARDPCSRTARPAAHWHAETQETPETFRGEKQRTQQPRRFGEHGDTRTSTADTHGGDVARAAAHAHPSAAAGDAATDRRYVAAAAHGGPRADGPRAARSAAAAAAPIAANARAPRRSRN